jgi:transposase InsO family protein
MAGRDPLPGHARQRTRLSLVARTIDQHVCADRYEGAAANWLDRDFVADAPNRKWAGDITYVWTAEGWLYLAVILDLHSRRVVGWAAALSLCRKASKALNVVERG